MTLIVLYKRHLEGSWKSLDICSVSALKHSPVIWQEGRAGGGESSPLSVGASQAAKHNPRAAAQAPISAVNAAPSQL